MSAAIFWKSSAFANSVGVDMGLESATPGRVPLAGREEDSSKLFGKELWQRVPRVYCELTYAQRLSCIAPPDREAHLGTPKILV
jgi:hypothetical protein